MTERANTAPRRTASAANFVRGVKQALAAIDRRSFEDRYQDQLDLLLLGETVPAEIVPTPDPDCRDCRGCGYVCDCHGIEWTWARTDHGCNRERCRCWKARTP